MEGRRHVMVVAQARRVLSVVTMSMSAVSLRVSVCLVCACSAVDGAAGQPTAVNAWAEPEGAARGASMRAETEEIRQT